MAELGPEFRGALQPARTWCNTGTEFVNDPESGQPIEQTKFAISDDRAPTPSPSLADDDATGDSITLYDNTEKGIAGIGLASPPPGCRTSSSPTACAPRATR
jgi:hypothetical protein